MNVALLTQTDHDELVEALSETNRILEARMFVEEDEQMRRLGLDRIEANRKLLERHQPKVER